MGRRKGCKNKLTKDQVKNIKEDINLDKSVKEHVETSSEKIELTKEQLERKEKLNSTLKGLNSTLGKDSIKYANTIEIRQRIPFKQKCLTTLTGGGIPKGLHTVIWGSKSCGKTTIVLDLIAEAQKSGNQCAYINGERSYDPLYAQKRGVDTESLVIVDVETLEQGLDAMIKLCRESVVDLIIFDSLHGLAPKGELYAGKGEKEKSTSDSNMALRARALTQYFEMGMSFVSKAKCAIVLIAQSRMDLGAFVKLETLTGGHALLHNSRLTLRFRRGQKADAPVEVKMTDKPKTDKDGTILRDKKGNIRYEEEKIQVGFDFVAHVDKSQIDGCTEGNEIHIAFYFAEGIKE